jgi:divalent metal cation (Fe/Co/Zn/Cd) transporter
MGGLFAIYEGISKLRDPHEVENLWVAVGILVFAICLETFSLRTAHREASHHKPAGMSWWKWIRTSKQPELPVVLLEDIGAEIGLFLALAGVLAARATGDPRWDAVGSLAIGVLLVVIAITLAIETKGLLIGESASEADQAAIGASLATAPAVTRVINVQTQHLGPEELLVAAKIEFERDLSVEELATAINGAEAALRAAVPTAHLVFIEPDIYRAVST